MISQPSDYDDEEDNGTGQYGDEDFVDTDGNQIISDRNNAADLSS